VGLDESERINIGRCAPAWITEHLENTVN